MLFLLTIVLGLFSSTLAQNCGFYSSTNETIITPRLNETTPGSFIVWSGLTFDVNVGASEIISTGRFLTGEWSGNMFILRTHQNYTYLVNEERDLEKFDSTIDLVCSDGGNKLQHFSTPFVWIRDPMNRLPPRFDKRGYSKTISLSSDNLVPISIPIIVTDDDARQRNANVNIRASNPAVNLFVTALWNELDVPQLYSYQVDFLIDKNSLELGLHEVILTADDGTFSNSAYLDLTITP